MEKMQNAMMKRYKLFAAMGLIIVLIAFLFALQGAQANAVFFSVDKLRRHVGWEPELTFKAAVERTWRWYQAEGLPDSQDFDFGFEDELIRMVRERQA